MDSGKHAQRHKPTMTRKLIGFFIMVIFILVLSWSLRTFIFQPYEIPSGSMENTIMTGDMVFSEKVSYGFRDPKPGEIITFQDPEIPGRVLIKRCIATAGQTVNLVNGKVVVDGEVRDEPYTDGKPSEPLKTAVGVEINYPYTVPPDCLWVMGDNRTNSSDSRHFGPIEKNTVTGRATLVYWPLSQVSVLN